MSDTLPPAAVPSTLATIPPMPDYLETAPEFTPDAPPPPLFTPTEKAEPWWKEPWVRLALAVILLITGVFVFITARADKAAAGEIFLEGSDTPGTQTFTPSVAEAPPAQLAPNALETPAPSTDGTIQTSGASPGLYAGQRNVPSCNAGNLVAFLEANANVARPWAGALGLNPADIRAYVATLTPVLLRTDTRVTEFKLAGNRAVPNQAILEAGTAVFVDRAALPRVRCAGGNPLGEPRPVVSRPRYRGTRWPRFRPTTVIVVTPAPTTTVIILVDAATGATFGRIPGSTTIIDIDRPAAGANVIVVEPGGRARFTGRDWPGGTAVGVFFDNPPANLGADVADGGGNVTVDVVIPRTAAPGEHVVSMQGGGFAVPQTVYVIPPAPRTRGR